MAAEVLHQNYQFRCKLLDAKTTYARIQSKPKYRDPSRGLIKLKNEVPFEHNYAHDVESLYWLAVFILFFNEDVHAPLETEEVTGIRRECSAYVFPGNMAQTQGHRASLIRNPEYFLKYSRWFGESFNQFLHPLFGTVSLFGPVYNDIYNALERGTPPKTEIRALELLYCATITAFETCQESSRNMEIRSRKSKGLEGNKDAPQQPETNSGARQPPGPKANDQQPPEPKPSEHNTRKREREDAEKEEEEYKILGAPKYPRREQALICKRIIHQH